MDVERLIVPIRLLLSMPVRSRVHGPAPTLLQRWTGWDGDEPGRWRRLLPRPETTLILLSLGWTIAAKSKVLGGQQPESLFASVVESTLPDVAFFATMLALFSGLFLFGLQRTAARIALTVAGLILIWSVMNAAWLLSTSVQLQPGVVTVLLKAPAQMWPTVQAHLLAKPLIALPIVASILGCVGWLGWRLLRPMTISAPRVRGGTVLAVSAVIAVVAFSAHELERRAGGLEYAGQVLGFSSHWHAVKSTLGLNGEYNEPTTPSRQFPSAGQRDIAPPPAGAPKPNVVIIFLESVSYDATSLSDAGRGTTPTLNTIADQGVEFQRTYVPVPQTNKAFFAALTGSTPDIAPDYAESVLRASPYESLASILRQRGYRSGFFQMADGAFECGPGLFHNLNFDWAWFFENFEDESARLGYLSADDHQMIQPMFEWVDKGEQPFLLTTITTVAHDPYILPDSFAPDAPESRYARYLKAVEYSDAFVAKVIEQLEQRGLMDNTILCVLGDHGESFRPDARRGRWVPYEEVIRVPWVMRWPGHIQPGASIEQTRSQIDVTPTLLSLLGYDITDAGFDGRNALELSDTQRRVYFASWYEDSPTGYLQGDRKFIYWPYVDNLYEYDLADDPHERKPVEIPDGPIKQRVQRELRSWRERSQLVIPDRGLRERLLFEHWRTASSQRDAWARYEP